MTGIYAIKNTINDKIYIGRSTDIERRWKAHLCAARNNDPCKIHLAMKELGLENFYLEIIEECSLELLNEREQYYIDYYNSWHDGYNNGESKNFLEGENNPNAKLTKRDIAEIRSRQSKLKENRREIFNSFSNKITWTNFLFICKYKTWVNILPEYNTKEIMEWHKKQLGNESIKMDKDELIRVFKLRKEGLSCTKIGKIIGKSKQTIERVINGTYYKKEAKEIKDIFPELF